MADKPNKESEERVGGYNVSTKLSDADKELGSYLVTFETVDNPSVDEQRLAKDIVLLDHRSLRLLGALSKQRSEVRDLIGNAVGIFHQREPQVARSLLDRAEAIFLQHMQAKNRLRYLGGVILGCIFMSLFGTLLVFVPGFSEKIIPTTQLPSVLLFAFMGTITSVMLRLSSIDLRDQTSMPLILLSGAARPITAVIFALVLYLLVAANFLELHIGSQDDTSRQYLYMLVSFLCGFSERFASDILSRFGGELGPIQPPDAAHKDPKSKRSPS
jgi:hypothetical protein